MEHLVSFLRPRSFEAEQYRTLRHSLEVRHRTDSPQTVSITSPGTGEGKTTTALNLAGALAQSTTSSVLLIDGDLRRPSVAASLRMARPVGPGLAGLLTGEGLDLDAGLRRLCRWNLSVLAAEQAAEGSPYELLKSPRFSLLMEEARRRFDYVLVDCPPLLAVPDARLIQSVCDGVVLVVSAHATPRRFLEASLELIPPSSLIGLVFNNDTRPMDGYNRCYGTYERHADPPARHQRPLP
jgi:capsular exopolysaccharide synthesis family protein